MKKFLGEPLVHFLVIGALLFVLYPLSKPDNDAAAREVIVDEARIASLTENFTRLWQRSPTQEELKQLVDDYVLEEILVREAKALGLEHDDPLIRRRLRQKMQFVAEEKASIAQPGDAELDAYLQAHADKFRIDAAYTFEHVFLSPAKRGTQLAADAQSLLNKLNARPDKSAKGSGDTLNLIETSFRAMPLGEARNTFGEEFAKQLPLQPTARWAGPVRSTYGIHLVRVDAVVPAHLPKLEDVRQSVEQEWQESKRREAIQAFVSRLNYQVRVAQPEAMKSALAPTSPTS